MLSDRTYMRDDYPRERTSVLVWLISAMVAGFVLQLVMQATSGRPMIFGNLDVPLSVAALKAGHVWTLVTYSFLHDPGNLFHILFDVMVLYYVGKQVLPVLGPRRFLGVFFVATIAGGLAWAALHYFVGGGMFIGATAAIDALLVIFACFYPNQEMNLLLLFVFPVRITPKQLAWCILGYDAFGFLFYEIQDKSMFGTQPAHSAHLAGMLTGWLYYRYVHDAGVRSGSGAADIELPRWMKRKARGASAPAYQLNLPNRGDLRAEVDRILDKINSQGFGALSAEERKILDEAKDALSRR